MAPKEPAFPPPIRSRAVFQEEPLKSEVMNSFVWGLLKWPEGNQVSEEEGVGKGGFSADTRNIFYPP